MGRNIPWRKTLIFSLLLILTLALYSEPLIGKQHKPEWKVTVLNRSVGLIGSRGDYKNSKILYFKDYDKNLIEKQFKQLTKKNWDKYLNITFKRLLPYRDFIAKEVDRQGVPFELIYLPIIESAAHPMATSNRGATGLWQFMSNSSGAYDMKTTEWIDERRDFMKSTRGAISKLNYNYKVTGDWLLALAAYNCGLNRVKTVVKNTGINDFWELSRLGLLPKETIKYIPKLILISTLLQNKNEYNLPIKWDINEWKEVTLTHAIDIRMLSKKAGIPFKELKSGNSELNYNVTPPINTLYKLKIPAKYTENVMDALSSQEDLMEFYRYKVKSGDTLSEIGYYYGISTPGLIRYNPGVSARTLRVGKTLIVPAIKQVEPYGKNIKTRIFKNNYTVRDGDTLWDISIRFDTTVEEIALNNGLGVENYIKKGMRLKVP